MLWVLTALRSTHSNSDRQFLPVIQELVDACRLLPQDPKGTTSPQTLPIAPTRATHSKSAFSDGIVAGQRLATSLNDTPRPVVAHSVLDATRKPLTCGNVSAASPDPPKWPQRRVIDAPRWHESGVLRLE